jgi:hypothetical protein
MAFNTCLSSGPQFNQSRSTFKVLGNKVGISWVYERLTNRYEITLPSQDLVKVALYDPVIILGRL